MPALPVQPDAEGIRVRVRLTPRGGRDQIEGIEILADGLSVLKARVRAAPENGLANEALERLMAATFAVPRSAVTVIRGGSSRVKTVRIAGDAARLTKMLERL